VANQDDGVVLEGTLVAEDYIGLEEHDLLWFKLPLGEERLEFFAQVYTTEIVGPKEARFRTVPTPLAEPVVAALKRAIGSAFQRSPYEIWPLLSSPCDLYSLGVLATRMLLANSQSNLPVVLDEILSLAQHFGKEASDTPSLVAQLRILTERDQHVLDLISPHALTESGESPAQARARIPLDLWLESIALLLRFFPGVGAHSFSRSLGDVSPQALETVFDVPIQEVENLVVRLRAALIPTFGVNEEIAGVLSNELAAGEG
jgi:hypothetical protein